MGSKSTKLPDQDKEYIMSKTSYSGAEIRKYYERFCSEYPNGRITRQQFVSTYKEGHPNNIREAAEYAKRLFQGYDIDGDGTIDFKEFMVTMAVGAKGTPREKLEWAFNMYDINRDNELTNAEIVEIIIATQRFVGEKVDISEAEEAAHSIFMHLDINRDCTVSRSEFVEGALLSDKVLNRLLK